MDPLRPASRTAPPNFQKTTLKEWKSAGEHWQWVEQPLADYKGHRLHVEFSPVEGGELAIGMVVQADEKPPLPDAPLLPALPFADPLVFTPLPFAEPPALPLVPMDDPPAPAPVASVQTICLPATFNSGVSGCTMSSLCAARPGFFTVATTHPTILPICMAYPL